MAVPCEGDPEPTRPVASSSRPLGHVPPRPDQLELQASFDRDEHRFRLSHVYLTPGTAELSLSEGRHRLHEDCCRYNGFGSALNKIAMEWHWRPDDMGMVLQRHTTSTTRRQTRQEDCVCCYPSVAQNIIHRNILCDTFKTPKQYLLNITGYIKKTCTKLPGQLPPNSTPVCASQKEIMEITCV